MTASCTLDLTSPAVIADPYPHFDQARGVAPVQWHEGLGMWLALSHAACDAVLRSRTLGRIWVPRWPERPMPAFTLIHENSMLETEPPVHTRLRRLVSAAFGRGHVQRVRPRIVEMAGRLADDVEAAADSGTVDLVARYAEPLPVQVIAELLGVPEQDWPMLRPWSNAIVKMYEYRVTEQQRVAAERAAADFVDYLRVLVRQRRQNLTDDLISSLIAAADADGARLSEDELITTCTLLLNAGHEATVNVTANSIVALNRNRGEWDRLIADRALVPAAVEELIRFDSPLQLFERTAVADTEIGGVLVRTSQKIGALLGAANRDPVVFQDPATLDISRTNNPHLGFGGGIHFCLGAPLARLELQISLSTLLHRFPAMHLAAPVAPPQNFVIRGVRSLVVEIR